MMSSEKSGMYEAKKGNAKIKHFLHALGKDPAACVDAAPVYSFF
jgi:hypothetical protein